MVCPVILVCFCAPAAAQDFPDYNNFGGTGIIDMPSATMAPDGHLAINASYMLDTQHYNLTFQALPWLETGFRYSGLTHFDPNFPVYWDRAFAVKARLFQEGDITPALAIGINDLIGTGIYSGEYVVATKTIGSVEATLGMGWGRLGSANSFRNPLSLISKSFDTRDIGYTGEGGEFSFGKYFHGPAAIFGGVLWHTPIENLTLKAEYSSDGYVREKSVGGFTPLNQVNFGATYRAFDNIVVALDWMYGRSIGGSITFDLNPTSNPYPQRIEPPPVPLNIRSDADQTMALRVLKGESSAPARSLAAFSGDALWNIPDVRNVAISGATLELTLTSPAPESCGHIRPLIDAAALNINTILVRDEAGGHVFRCTAQASGLMTLEPAIYRANVAANDQRGGAPNTPLIINAAGAVRENQAAVAAKLRKDAATQNLAIQTISLQHGIAVIQYTNGRYQAEAEAVDKLLRVAMADLPPEIEEFRFIAVKDGLVQAEYKILRSVAERTFEQEGAYDLLATQSGPMPAPMSGPGLGFDRSRYPHFTWILFPQLRQEFFDPSNPLGLQLVAGAFGSLEVLPGLTLNGEAEASIADTFTTGRPSDSVLPHVRTDFLEYFNHGSNGIGQLSANYQFRLAPTVFASVKAGYLESMFGGIGGEILWRPEGQRWAVGADLYEVKQRGYDRLFDFLPYRQTTGHVTLYYDSPWYGINFQLRAGQYLAGDRGITFQASRRFSTGVEVGFFATKTNVSAAQFGEGSFDKGIFLNIPLEWVLPMHTQVMLHEVLRSIQRDGGQVLAGDATLFDQTRATSEADARLLQWN